ncbi:hypothetical protein [Actinopolyspora mortivallis]|uniref:Uncharacterized protein n=1 Tax=Actinopolyspora mortivallis TaxID=33906 RepID=A0A2T0H0A9_ACTMO|nr:hypothetical protein [Actinopolyspora mortivallis]PRW64795.1 hypothetical protein CEP50_02960 [Actinopolyspora mortivallis]
MQQLEHAARALGWNGHLVSDLEVLGSRFTAVTRLLFDVHQWRTAHGWPPESDPARIRSWAEEDTHDRVPVPAVELVGLLVRVSKARKAPRACGTLITVAPCAAVLPGNHPYRPWALTELDYYGIGAVTAHRGGPAELVLAPEDRRTEFGTSLFERWLWELLYERLLRHHPENTGNAGVVVDGNTAARSD